MSTDKKRVVSWHAGNGTWVQADEPKKSLPKPNYLVEPRPSSYPTEWSVYRLDSVGTYTHVANYKHRAPAQRVANELNHWADEESES